MEQRPKQTGETGVFCVLTALIFVLLLLAGTRERAVTASAVTVQVFIT